MTKEIIFNRQNFETFLNSFDEVDIKYFYFLNEGKKAQYFDEIQEIRECISEINNHDEYFFRCNADESSHMYETINTIYYNTKEDDLAFFYTNVVQLVYKKMIYNYLDIENIDELFDSRFFDFERKMHYEFQNNKKPYYRDHYIHQVRNFFEMFELLNTFEFDKKALEIYSAPNSKIGKYLNKKVEQQMILDNKDKIKDVYDKLFSLYKKSLINSSAYSEKQFKHDFYLRDILYRTAILSSLFHDVGYIMEFMYRMNDELENFLPNSDYFVASVDRFSEIQSFLNKSLLFTIVPIEEIKNRFYKHNHGTLSAITLLLFFYKRGLINSMKPCDAAIIELGAVVIYNHTLHFEFQTEQSNAELYKNIYLKNPLSYLFRICDDIQEWDRTYFEITDKSNVFICDRCHMPMISVGNKRYRCACMEHGRNLNNYTYRRTMNAVACRNVVLSCDDTETYLRIDINYDLKYLLQLSLYNPSYAAYRSKDIKELKKGFMYQQKFPYVYLDAFVSFNPIAIKAQAMENVYKLLFLDVYHVTNDIIADFKSNDINGYKAGLSKLRDSLEMNNNILHAFSIFYDCYNSVDKNVIQNNLSFYSLLILVTIDDNTQKNIQHSLYKIMQSIVSEKTTLDKFVYALCSLYDVHSRVIRDLVSDCIRNRMNVVEYEQFVDIHKGQPSAIVPNNDFSDVYQKYINMWQSSEHLQTVVEAYTDLNNPNNDYLKYVKNISRNCKLDFYSDYFVFQVLCDVTEWIKNLNQIYRDIRVKSPKSNMINKIKAMEKEITDILNRNGKLNKSQFLCNKVNLKIDDSTFNMTVILQCDDLSTTENVIICLYEEDESVYVKVDHEERQGL